MPLPQGSKVLFQKRIKNKLVLFVRTKEGKIIRDVRKKCKCPNDKSKPCKCK